MKTTYPKFLCLLMAFCLLFGCKPNSSKEVKTGTNVTDVKSNQSNSKTVPATTTEIKSGTKPELPKTETTNLETTKPELETPKEEPPTSTLPVNKLCGDASFDLGATANKAANELKGIMYNREASAKADCSGIYHRVLDKFKDVCPDAKTPAFNKVRDSRSLAAWYNKNGNFKIIRTPAAEADLIQPGAVMFYGYGKRRNHYDFQKMNMDTLTLRGTGINHIAIVTSVNRVDGDLVSYELFHGRTDNKASAVTKSYKVTSWDATWPMYGNALEPWLAVATSPLGN